MLVDFSIKLREVKKLQAIMSAVRLTSGCYGFIVLKGVWGTAAERESR